MALLHEPQLLSCQGVPGGSDVVRHVGLRVNRLDPFLQVMTHHGVCVALHAVSDLKEATTAILVGKRSVVEAKSTAIEAISMFNTSLLLVSATICQQDLRYRCVLTLRSHVDHVAGIFFNDFKRLKMQVMGTGFPDGG